MNIYESVSSAVTSILSNKMRSILTTLGIIIGISAVIMITAIGMGFQQSVKDDFAKLGMDGLQVYMRYDAETESGDYLTLDDRKVLEAHPDVRSVSSLWQTYADVRLRNEEETQYGYIFGTDKNYRDTQNLEMVHGRFLMDVDAENRSSVVVIDETLSKQVFGTANGVGQTLKVSTWFGNLQFTVIGITKSEDLGMLFNMPPMLFVPVTTIMEAYGWDYVDQYFVMLKDGADMDKTAQELNMLLEKSHQNKDKYTVSQIMQGIDTIYDVLNAITAFVGLVAGISLVVGGIGVMNIMLVTVTERTREIGIRKSLGATDGNIKFQFLVEAMILTAIGGLIGIVLGLAGAFYLGSFIDIVPLISVPIVIGTVIVSCGIGIAFGVYPAGKAAKLDPIEALRYD